MNSSFVNFVKSIIKLPKEQEIKLGALITTKHLKKNDDFISAGEHPKTIAFIKIGLFRYYYANEQGEEFTKAFFSENSLLSSYSAIIEKRPSYFSIQALEDSEIEVLNYQEFLKLFAEYPEYNTFLLGMLQRAFLVKEERERQFLLFDAEKRYVSFLKHYPNLEERIKQHLIASYLRITPESLSRVRRKMNLLP